MSQEKHCTIHPDRIAFVIVTDNEGNNTPCFECYKDLVIKRQERAEDVKKHRS